MKNASTITRLATEGRNPHSLRLDRLSTRGILKLIHRNDQQVPRAVGKALPQITRAVDLIVARRQKGGRLLYVGAGTSGRIGILDAVECVPTFNVAADEIQGIIAGGYEACYRAVEASEDDARAGARDLRKRRLTRRDIVVGIAASGRTPYTCGALTYARRRGAATIAIVNNPESEMKRLADVTIEALTGPEVLTGSTRMKAGSAQKMICNMLSTASMIKLGAVYSNLMIHVHMKNEKLVQRGVRILRQVTGVSEKQVREALRASMNDLRVAAVMLEKNQEPAAARKLLNRYNGNLRKALESS